MQIGLLLLLAVIGLAGLILWTYIWDKPKLLIYAQVVLSMMCGTLTSMLGLPNAVSYLMDVINVNLLILVIIRVYKKDIRMNLVTPVCLIGLAVFVTLCSWMVNKQEVLYYLWGVRNNFRFFAFFISTAYFLDMEDIKKIMRVIMFFFWVSIPLSSYQFFVLGMLNDNVGGIYGVADGCNAGVQMILAMVSAYTIVMFMSKKIGYVQMLLVTAAAMYFAAITELKVFFIEYALMAIVAIIFSKKSERTIAIIIFTVAFTVGACIVLIMMYPEWLEFFSIDSMMEYASSSYSNEGEVSRTNGISFVSSRIFTNMGQRLLGVGFGNADTSAFFASDFFTKYNEIRYNWFYATFLFVEIGILGLISYIIFALYVGLKAFMGYFYKIEVSHWYLYAFIGVVMYFVMMVYNIGLKQDYVYIYDIVFIIPFVMEKRKKVKNSQNGGAEVG